MSLSKFNQGEKQIKTIIFCRMNLVKIVENALMASIIINVTAQIQDLKETIVRLILTSVP